MTAFSDYILYVDESGSPVLDGVDPDYPVFVLVFLLVEKSHYADTLVPALQRLKFDFAGHDQLILHERDIRRQSGDFAFLQASAERRTAFLERINALVGAAEITLICAVIHKEQLKYRYADPWSPYELALMFCMERALKVLMERNQAGRQVHVIFESRGKNEDRHLELQFRRIADGEVRLGTARPRFRNIEWEPQFVDKRSNSAGLQLADLIARPAGLRFLRPDQPNRAYDAFADKILFPGIKCFP